MKRISVMSVGLAALAGLVSTSRDANALGPVDVEIGAKVGGATNPADSPNPNPLGLGVGARGGVAIFGFYGGLNAMYYVGSGTDYALGTVTGHTSTHALQLGLEAGYGFKLSLLTIRPQIGFGNMSFSGTSDTSVRGGGTVSTDVSNSHFYLEPGVTGIVSLGLLFVGADANILLIPGVDQIDNQGNQNSKTLTSFTLHAQVGVKL